MNTLKIVTKNGSMKNNKIKLACYKEIILEARRLHHDVWMNLPTEEAQDAYLQALQHLIAFAHEQTNNELLKPIQWR